MSKIAPKCLVIIPAFNEEKRINDVLSRLKEIRNNSLWFDILVIDDGSTDRTADIVKSHNVMLIRHEKNCGEEGAIQTGFDYALKHDYDFVVKIDADGQHLPDDIIRILNLLLKGKVDVVIGARTKNYKESLLFKLGRFVCSTVISILVRKRLTDVTSGFKGRCRRCFHFSRELYIKRKVLQNDMLNDIEEIILYSKKGFNIAEVPVRMNPREEASKCYFSTRLLKFPFEFIFTIIKCLMMNVESDQG